jgi:hypothetical protein
MFLRVYDMPAPNESVAGRVCRAIAGLMIGGGWQEVIGWSPSDVRCCKENAVHVKMTKSWHVTNTSPRYHLPEVLLEIG